MSMRERILETVLSGLSDRNVRFEDLRKLLLSLNFSERINGDHHIFHKKNVAEIVNLQPLKDGKAKPYQVKQVRNLLLKYKLHNEDQNA